jgi:hypothetical protein
LGKTQGDDTYLLKYVLHDWDDERAVKILESCRRSMTADAKLLVMELMIPVTDEPSRGKLMDVSMMLLLSGGERTSEAYRALLAAAGFRLERVVPTTSQIEVSEARPDTSPQTVIAPAAGAHEHFPSP